jgi:predicted nuclease of predicted toxin-antitoxin system
MKPRFLVDAQLPPALADRLSSMGYYAEHVARVGLGGAGDNAIWAYAKQSGMILITKDEDFVSTASRGEMVPQVIWIRLGNTTNRALWQVLSEIFSEILRGLEAGERVIEIISRDNS